MSARLTISLSGSNRPTLNRELYFIDEIKLNCGVAPQASVAGERNKSLKPRLFVSLAQFSKYFAEMAFSHSESHLEVSPDTGVCSQCDTRIRTTVATSSTSLAAPML